MRRGIKRNGKRRLSPVNVVLLAGHGVFDWPPINTAAGLRCLKRVYMEFSPGHLAFIITCEKPESGFTEAEAVSGAGPQCSPSENPPSVGPNDLLVHQCS